MVCSPAGEVVQRLRLQPWIRELPPPPSATPEGLVAQREGADVVVRWRTAHPVPGLSFQVYVKPFWAALRGTQVVVGATRQTEFTVRLTDVPAAVQTVGVWAADFGRPIPVEVPIG